MNAISTLWKAVVDDLVANKETLGIDGAERAATGQVTTLSPPAVAVWIGTSPNGTMTSRGKIHLALDVFFFCVAAPDDVEADAVDKALDIAAAVFSRYAYRTIGGVLLEQSDGETIEVLERSSNAAIVGVTLRAKVVL